MRGHIKQLMNLDGAAIGERRPGLNTVIVVALVVKLVKTLREIWDVHVGWLTIALTVVVTIIR